MKVVTINMRMPQSCYECELERGCRYSNWSVLIPDSISQLGKERPADCPLKEVEISTDSELNPQSDDINEIIDYLNMATGSSYRAKTPKNRQLIQARMREGFTVDDFKTVIDKKVRSWGKDPRMKDYLRPVTLFGTKFESYLNEKCTSRLGENSFQRMQRMAREGAFDE